MNKFIRLAIWVIGLTAPVVASAAPITWSFYETAITSCNSPRDSHEGRARQGSAA
jgi:hypothetical protein